jgi:hypothetical protein
MIGALVNTYGKWKLKKLFAKSARVPVAMNIQEMKTTILVFEITDESSFLKVSAFASKLKQTHGFSKVNFLGFNKLKELPSFILENEVKVLGLSEIDMSGVPKPEFTKAILGDDYDLLVDFTQESLLPTDYFLALINAKTKVGQANKDKEYIFDLLIELEDKTDVTGYLENVVRYLKMINK